VSVHDAFRGRPDLKVRERSRTSCGRSATSPAGAARTATRRSAAAASASDSTAVARLWFMTCRALRCVSRTPLQSLDMLPLASYS